MAVKRIVVNIATQDFDRARAFYGDILGLEMAMDLGWIQTYVGTGLAAPQVSFAREGGSGTDVPDLSIEVDNLDEVYQNAIAAKIPILYGPVEEPWGVRRFYLKDPFGRVVNILTHRE
ncbi:glyoxalase [Sneathiella chungangensis]|uniref:Glyoxalase n=1 Tax=Sneathiella chungangensis TaxID=1418234 RepID=A0A845MM91_9PROT|nr:VOC family protein [Sneathiella chungangensis]MZR24156.1 glyoxalase [Sneathiella chungangensis]